MSAPILITGGTGYIGSHTVVELMQAGYEVVVIDNLSNSSLSVLDGIERITDKKPYFEQVDMGNKEALRDFFRRYSPLSGCIHFAAAKAVGESVTKPLTYYANNLNALIHLLECMSEYELSPLVFSSSCTVYGQPDDLPVTEQAPIKPPLSPYGNTKQIAEEIITDTQKAEDLVQAVSLRYFNPVGAHPSANIGELPQGVPNNLVPYITQTAFGIREYLKVFGGDYETRDGTCIRDYIHVVDLAQAHIQALERLLQRRNKQPYEVFNLGTGKGYTVLEVVASFEKAVGKTLPYQIVERRPGDIESIYADTKWANQELGWEARRGLDDMMATAWAWEQYYRRSNA